MTGGRYLGRMSRSIRASGMLRSGVPDQPLHEKVLGMAQSTPVRYVIFGRTPVSDPPAESGDVAQLPTIGTEVELTCGTCVVISVDASASPVLLHCRLKGATTPQ